MKKKLLIISILISMVSAGAIKATEYIVNQKSRSADDNGPGTIRNPFRTIGSAVSRLKPGDHILIYPGIYRESIDLKISGTESNPVVIEAATAGKVIIKGSVIVTGWKQESAGSPKYIHEGWGQYFGPRSPNEKDARGKPRNQLFANGVLIEEVFQPGDLKEGTFFIDKDKQQITLWLTGNSDPGKKIIEVSDRETLFNIIDCSYVVLRGIRFEHGTCAAQRSLVRVTGSNCLVEDCSMSLAAGTGFGMSGRNHVVRRCIFNNNGQQGFTVSSSVECRMEDCESSYNNRVPGKLFNINWEAGGNKIARSYHLVVERHQAHYNIGDGLWFDISNNECEIKNCLCTNNSRSGIFWEISFKAYIHDNVLMFNNTQGILLAESKGPEVERNLMIGNAAGLTFRDMLRTTSPAVDASLSRAPEEAIWNHNEIVKNNVMAFNRNSQVRGAFLNKIERMMPAGLQKVSITPKAEDAMVVAALDYAAKDDQGQPIGLSLEKLNVKVNNNIYWTDTIPDLYRWGEVKFQTLEQVRKELKFESGGEIANPLFANWQKMDLRVPKNSVLVQKGCYPKGVVPKVKLGTR